MISSICPISNSATACKRAGENNKDPTPIGVGFWILFFSEEFFLDSESILEEEIIFLL
jgi:hypothetical protein